MYASAWHGRAQGVVDGGVGGRASAPGVNGLTKRARVTKIEVDSVAGALEATSSKATSVERHIYNAKSPSKTTEMLFVRFYKV